MALSPSPRFLVVQNGARHDYAIPDAFERAGALSGVYTDFVATSLPGRILGSLASGNPRATNALTKRKPPSSIAAKVHSNDFVYLANEMAGKMKRRETGDSRIQSMLKNAQVGWMAGEGYRDATHIYTMLGEGDRFVEDAKRSGLGVVGDVFIALSSDAIVARECEQYPDWADEALVRLGGAIQPGQNRVLLETSDLFVCPSEFVRDDLVAHHGVPQSKTIVAPYAVSPKWLDLKPETVTGQVLFAGSATVRKGIHHLAAAATLLKDLCEFRVAGGVTDKVRAHSDAGDLEFMGHLGKDAMAREFSRADVFVLPSLAEGSASVTAEALGAGVPVVTTKASGSIVRDGVDGTIVPEGNPEAIAKAVEAIVKDRDLRESMSRAARERAQQFGWDGFAKSVIDATMSASSAPEKG